MTQTIRIQKPEVLEEIPTDESSVVEASAGTGKTFALEHLIVELILEEQIAISNLLVVTFTERATAELVERVRGILERLVDQRESDAAPDEPHWEVDPAARERLREALFSFDRAPIYTIHGFCHRVLVEHAFANRQPFEQELAEFDALYQEAFSRALRREFTADTARSLVLETYLAEHSVDTLRSQIAEAIRTTDRVEPVGDFEAFAESLEGFEEALVGFRETFREMWSVFERVDEEGGMHGVKRGKVWRQMRAIEAAYEGYDDRGVAGFFGRLNAEAGDAPFAYLDDPGIFNKSHRDAFRESWSDELRRLDEVQVVPLPLIFDAFVPIVEEYLEELKAEQSTFTYDDMLELVRRAVCGPGSEDLVETLREEYRFALVDEFQDTDPVQWEIFRRLFVESDGSRPCVLIGDPKQAIYGFRGADVRTYFRARDEVVERGARTAPVKLDDNYRSTASLIAAYNRILDQTAAEPFFREPNVYSDPVDCGEPRKALVDRSGDPVEPVVVTRIESRDEDPFSADGYRGALAREWAAEIRDLLRGEDGGAALEIWDDETEQLRPLAANDIYVLTRTRKAGDKFAEHLRAEGVPYAFYKREGLFETPEARDWYRVLRAVVRPGDRSRRLKAWTTPFFDLGLAEAAEADEWVDEHHELVDRLNQWSDLARAGRIGQLVHRILDETGLLRREVFERHGERELTNYQHLGELVVDWAQSEEMAVEGIAGRLGRYIEGEAEPEGSEGDMQRLETERQAVQIMTMHKAKGLSAPVVFLVGGYQYNSQPPHRFYDEEGERVLFFGSKGDGGAIDAYRDEEAERLLYVAMTRPEGRLYLPYAEPDDHGGRLGRSRSPMGPLMERLDVLLDAGAPPGFRVERRYADPRPPGGEAADGGEAEPVEVDVAEVARRVDEPSEGGAAAIAFGEMRARRRLFVESYSSVDRWQRATEEVETGEALELDERAEATADEELEEPAPEGPPLGRRTGLCVHALLEELDYERAAEADGRESWSGRDRVAELFDEVLVRYGLEEHRSGIEELVWRALTAPVAADEMDVGPVAGVDRRTAELEFWYPIPGETGPSLRDLVAGDSRPRTKTSRGYVRGFIDLVFESEGRIYAADWKTNWLRGDDAYAPEAIERIVEERYEVQALFYATAAARLVARGVDGRGQFEERFGGLLYLFVRGMGPGEGGRPPGIYFERPDFEELCAWERRTGEMVAEKLDRRRSEIAEGAHDRWRVP